jgi:hypothetical protein
MIVMTTSNSTNVKARRRGAMRVEWTQASILEPLEKLARASPESNKSACKQQLYRLDANKPESVRKLGKAVASGPQTQQADPTS